MRFLIPLALLLGSLFSLVGAVGKHQRGISSVQQRQTRSQSLAQSEKQRLEQGKGFVKVHRPHRGALMSSEKNEGEIQRGGHGYGTSATSERAEPEPEVGAVMQSIEEVAGQPNETSRVQKSSSRPTTSSSTALFTHSYLSITSDINHYPTRAPSLSSKHSSTPPVSGGSYGKARSAPSAHPSASSARHAELLSPSQLAPRPPRPSSRLSKIFKSEGRTKVAGVDSSQSRLKAAATSSNFPSTPYRPSDPSLSPTGITPTFAPSTPMSAESTSLASSPNTLLSPAPSPPTSSLTSESTPISASPNEQVSSSLSSLASLASAQAEASDPSGSPSPTAFVMGGKKLSVLPIGLGVLGGVVAVGLLVVLYVTWERKQYRALFRRRRLFQQERTQELGGGGYGTL